MKIPKSFKQYGQTITVKIVKDLSVKHGKWGSCYLDENVIELQDNRIDGITLPDTKRDETFFHELLHTSLYFSGEPELGNNEKFVDVLAGLLHQAFTTAVYED